MELEELKSAWAELDSRLKENKSMNKTIVMKMAQSKADKIIGRLINWEIFSVVILILAIPLVFYVSQWFVGKLIVSYYFMLLLAGYCCIGTIWYIYKISGLMKIDFSKAISDNIYLTNRYNIQIKREKFAMNVVFGPIFAILLILSYAELKVNMQLWIFLICLLFLCSLITYWTYKRLYEKNISSILKSMNEIKQLEEEEDPTQTISDPPKP